MPDVRRRGRPRTAWIDNIKSWTGLSVGELIRMTEDRDKWRRYVHGVARTAKEQKRTELKVLSNRRQCMQMQRTRRTQGACVKFYATQGACIACVEFGWKQRIARKKRKKERRRKKTEQTTGQKYNGLPYSTERP